MLHNLNELDDIFYTKEVKKNQNRHQCLFNRMGFSSEIF